MPMMTARMNSHAASPPIPVSHCAPMPRRRNERSLIADLFGYWPGRSGTAAADRLDGLRAHDVLDLKELGELGVRRIDLAGRGLDASVRPTDDRRLQADP